MRISNTPIILASLLAVAAADMADMADHGDAHLPAPSQAASDGMSPNSHHHEEEESPVPHVLHHMHGMPILQTELLPIERKFWEQYNTTTYFNVESKHRGALYGHIIVGLLSIIFVYPVAIVFNNLNMTSWYLSTLVVHTTLVLVSLTCFSVFIKSIPDMYPGNAYNKMSWILLFSTAAHLVAAFVNFGYKYINNDLAERATGHEYFGVAGTDEDFEDQNSCDSPAITLYDLSRLGTTSNSLDLNPVHANGHLKTSSNSMLPPPVRAFSPIFKVFDWPVFSHINKTLYTVSKYMFNFLNWGHFFYFMIYIPTGVATFLLYGQGSKVFNLLAHFIKGGVFFAYGILTLARYSGAFSNKGWAWNHKYVSDTSSRWNRIQSTGLVTMECLESGLILFYGCTNIFLEHLANAGKPYSSKDLQHASIAFIYIGCGLCGVITESKLAAWRYEKAIDNYDLAVKNSKVGKILKASPGFSPNPFPVVTIFWTGILMSKHEQASPLSTEIHIQWGNMFILGCAFRLLTYILVLLLPVNAKALLRPLRPITELIVSFSLLCGGVIFMESTDPVVQSFEYHGLSPMFSLNVTLGFITLLMAWEMTVFALKDWLSKRSKRSYRQEF